MYVGLHVKYPLSFSDFNEPTIFSADFSINTQILNFMKIRWVGAELPFADGETVERRDEADSRFSQICERA